jgi:hypothetical protein
LHTLLDEVGLLYGIIEWTDSDRVLLAGEGGEEWWLDPFTGRLMAINER